MRAGDIIKMIPEEMLDFLSAETKVDHKVQKLKGSILFKLILYSVLTTRNSSLRVLESVFHSYRFKALAGVDLQTETRFTSIRDRIATVKADYFEKLFTYCSHLFAKQVKTSDQHILRYDSTMIAISARILDFGMKVGYKTDKKQVKFTIGYNGLLPTSAKLFKEQQELGEDICLYEAITKAAPAKDDIVVFDRGLSGRKRFQDLSNQQIGFVTRINPSARFECLEDLELCEEQRQSSTLFIESDQRVYLFRQQGVVKCPLRLIRARRIESDEQMWFVTNLDSTELDAVQVTEIYRRRWDIEVFFKFLKQELDLEHVTVGTVNGLEVMLYVKLIAAILLKAYQELNGLKGYKILKMRFADQLEEDLIKEVVIICGGDPQKMYRDP
jgi:transposase